jgi:hypothetical protein
MMGTLFLLLGLELNHSTHVSHTWSSHSLEFRIYTQQHVASDRRQLHPLITVSMSFEYTQLKRIADKLCRAP